MVYSCIINSCFGEENAKLNPYLFIMFCNVFDYDMFVNMSTLKSPITIIGQSIGIFSKFVFKMEIK
jgi:hypothetical protein